MNANSSVRGALAAAVLLLVPPTAAAGPRVAVLTPTAPWSGRCDAASRARDAKLDERCAVLDTLADEARAGALAALEGRDVSVMTRENTAQILKEMGGGASACTEGECEVETAKLIGADYVVSGTVLLVEGSWFVTLKLHEVKTAKLLKTSDRVKGKSQVDLIEALRSATEAMVKAGVAGPNPPTISQPSASTSTERAATACPEGQEPVGGSCCWPGQDWGTSAGRCVGTPACPNGYLAKDDGCVPGCAAGKTLVSGHCCWPGQDWGVRSGSCVGPPSCPAGWSVRGGTCEGPPEGMVRMPAGTFKSSTGDTVSVAPTFIDVAQVSVAAYERCVRAGRCTPPHTKWCNGDWGKPGRGDRPVSCVDVDQAAAFCGWSKGRVPTEEEWEWAVRAAAGEVDGIRPGEGTMGAGPLSEWTSSTGYDFIVKKCVVRKGRGTERLLEGCRRQDAAWIGFRCARTAN